MGEFFKIAVDILAAVLPDSDAGKVGIFLILAFVVLVFKGRYMLEWIGTGVRHICRWLRCKVRNKHHWLREGIGWVNVRTGRETGTFVCGVCGKVWVRR